MHYWGDEWFKNNGNDLYEAINYIDKELRRYGIFAISKEKYGSRREDILHLWDGGIYSLLFGHRCFIGTYKHYKNEKLRNFIDQIHHFIYYTIDQGIPSKKENETFEEYSKRYEKRIWKGLSHYTNKIGLLKLVHKYQANMYNKTYQIACKKWPMIIDELIVMVDGYKMIKPCKWGNIDGEEIHNKYWRTPDQPKNEENLI